MINGLLYEEEDDEKYIVYLTKPLKEFNKKFNRRFKSETEAVEYAINHCIEERNFNECDYCKDSWDINEQTECDYYVCSMYLTQFLAEYGYEMEDFVTFECIEEF